MNEGREPEAAVYYAAHFLAGDTFSHEARLTMPILYSLLKPDFTRAIIRHALSELIEAGSLVKGQGYRYVPNHDRAIETLWRDDYPHQKFLNWIEEKLRKRYLRPVGALYQFDWEKCLPWAYFFERDCAIPRETFEASAQAYFAPLLNLTQLELISRAPIYFPLQLPDPSLSVLDWTQRE